MATPGGGKEASGMSATLQQVLGLIGQAMAAPDADQQFLGKLQQAIVQRLQQPSPQGQGGQGPGQPQMGPGGMPPGMHPGMPHPMPGGGVGGMGGFGGAGMGNAMPNPDELRRVLAGAGGPQ